jgi:hypothetical protein
MGMSKRLAIAGNQARTGQISFITERLERSLREERQEIGFGLRESELVTADEW